MKISSPENHEKETTWKTSCLHESQSNGKFAWHSLANSIAHKHHDGVSVQPRSLVDVEKIYNVIMIKHTIYTERRQRHWWKEYECKAEKRKKKYKTFVQQQCEEEKKKLTEVYWHRSRRTNTWTQFTGMSSLLLSVLKLLWCILYMYRRMYTHLCCCCCFYHWRCCCNVKAIHSFVPFFPQFLFNFSSFTHSIASYIYTCIDTFLYIGWHVQCTTTSIHRQSISFSTFCSSHLLCMLCMLCDSRF